MINKCNMSKQSKQSKKWKKKRDRLVERIQVFEDEIKEALKKKESTTAEINITQKLYELAQMKKELYLVDQERW